MEKSKAVANIIAGWFQAAAKGESSYPSKHMSKRAGTLLVGTDPKEWLRGKKAAEFLTAEAKATGGKIKVSLGRVEGWKEGTVGWGMANPTITLPGGKKFQPRWSAVLHKERGRWRIVQVHASVGVSNEQLLG